MFHKRTGHIAAALLLLSVSAQPIMSYAGEPIEPAAATQADLKPIVSDAGISSHKSLSFDEFRSETKVKLSETQQWIKAKTPEANFRDPIRDLEIKIDRFQDSVKPAGRSMKASLKNNMPGKGLIQLGDRSMSVFAFLLMMAFGFVFFMLSLSGASSRLGGRH